LYHLMYRIRGACFKKCIVRFAESELTLGEMSCIERFVVLNKLR